MLLKYFFRNFLPTSDQFIGQCSKIARIRWCHACVHKHYQIWVRAVKGSLKEQILIQVNIVWKVMHWPQERWGIVECQVHIISAVLDFTDINDVISNVHYLHPGVLEHFAVDVQVKVLLPLDDVTRSRHFYHIGVDDRFIVALFDMLDKYKVITCSHVHNLYYKLQYVSGPSIVRKNMSYSKVSSILGGTVHF